jgi:hypothetical protein
MAIKFRNNPIQRSWDVESQQVGPIEARAADSVSTYFATWMESQFVPAALGGYSFQGRSGACEYA